MAPMVWVALAALLVVAVTTGYWLINPEREQVVADVATTASTDALPAPETVPTHSAPQVAMSLPSPDNQPQDEATTPQVAASPPMAAPDQSPPLILSLPPVTEQEPMAVPSAEVPQVPVIEKPAAALGDKVFVVRFDSKVPGLTPTGLRALDAALRANNAGQKVRIAIQGCDSGDSPPNGVDCAALIRRLKKILVNSGVDHPAKLIASSYR